MSPRPTLAEALPALAAQWHPTRNEALTPADVTPGSNRKVWWVCAVCGHEWETTVASRANLRRPAGCRPCSYSARAENLQKFTLEDLHAHAAAKGGRCLATVFRGVNERHEWECGSCGRRWQAVWSHVWYKGSWCNHCSSARAGEQRRKYTRDDFALVAAARDGELLTREVTTAHASYRWRCQHGHEWSATGDKILAGQWCPTCGRERTAAASRRYGTQDLARVAAERGGVCLSTKFLGIHEKHQWQCGSCGTAWDATFNSVLRGTWCPGDACMYRKMSEALTRTTVTDLEAHAAAQGGRVHAEGYEGPHGRYEWECRDGHRWHASWASVGMSGTWCPVCSDSRLARAIAATLAELGVRYVVEKRFRECRSPDTGYQLPFDFYLPEVGAVIEADGIQHFQPVDRFGGEESFARTRRHDQVKDAFCAGVGLPLLRVPYTAQAHVGEMVDRFLATWPRRPPRAATRRHPTTGRG